MRLRKEGWQFKIDYHKDYVIKTPKTYAEIRKSVSNYLKFIGKSQKEELDRLTNKAINDYNTSLKIIKKSNVPKSLLGDITFLKNGKIKQKRAVVLGTRIKNLIKKDKTNEIKLLIDKYIILTLELWKYGIYEKVYNFTINNGIIKNKIVLLDLFELTKDIKLIKKQLKNRTWERAYHMKYVLKEIVPYFKREARKNFTYKNFNKLWESNL